MISQQWTIDISDALQNAYKLLNSKILYRDITKNKSTSSLKSHEMYESTLGTSSQWKQKNKYCI